MAICIQCKDEYSNRRKSLGYRTCLSCGSPKVNFPIIEVAKSNPIVGTLRELKNNNHKGPRFG